VRDTKTGAILSTDHDSIKAYERRKHEQLAQKERINKLEQELFDLKSLVSKLIEKR
jgi:hypothetical protein